MGGICSEIEIGGKPCWTLFGSGAKNSYVARKAAPETDLRELPTERTVTLGGKQQTVKQACLLIGRIDGHWIEFQAGVLEEIGKDDDGREIDVLLGALATQLWGIRLDLPSERVDLSLFSENFVEFTSLGEGVV